MLIGIFAALLTGALWALTFVAPRFAAPFSAFDLSVGRYLVFGLVSLLLMMTHRAFRPTGLTGRQLAIGLALGSIGYFGYFLSISYAVLLAGPVLPPLIAGTAPVVLAIIANVRDPALPWRRLAGPLLMILAGLAAVNIGSFGEATTGDRVGLVAGIGFALVSLVMWVGYGLVNSLVLRGEGAPGGLPWTGLQGLGSGGAALLLLPFMLGTPALADPVALPRFLVLSLVMGAAVSWVGTYGWVVASARLPLALSSQLIVAETVFGLVYGLLYEQRGPTPWETGGIILQLGGVIAAVALFAHQRAGARSELATALELEPRPDH